MSLTLFKRTESAAPIVPPSDFPDASSTGPAAGTVFTTTTGNFQSTAPGQIIEKRTINNGMIDIRHANVTVRDCIVNSQDAAAILTTGAGPFAGCVIERCKLTGIGGSFAIFSDNATNMEIRFCDISGYENGIAIGASGMNIHDNYIHDLFRLSGTPHIDGIQGSGGFTSLTIQHNTIVSWDTSCIIMQTEGGGFSGLVIDNNRLLFDTAHVGAELAYGILCQSVNANVAQNITITNNRIQKSQPVQNYIFANNLTQPVTISGNVDDTTGAPITPDGNVPLPASGIPMSYNDPIFASNVPATISPLPNGASAIAESFLVSNANGDPVLVCLGNNTIQKCRFGSPYVREGIRIAGPGLMFIDQCYINVDGLAGSGDHADGIQAFTPGDVGTIFLNNTFIRAYNNAAGPGGEGSVGAFISDNWTGTFKCRNVVFQSGQFGCRAHPDVGGDMHIDFDGVYFVGPYNSAAFDIGQSIGGHITVIDRWTNVFNATIVGGVLVPGTAIPPPV